MLLYICTVNCQTIPASMRERDEADKREVIYVRAVRDLPEHG